MIRKVVKAIATLENDLNAFDNFDVLFFTSICVSDIISVRSGETSNKNIKIFNVFWLSLSPLTW